MALVVAGSKRIRGCWCKRRDHLREGIGVGRLKIDVGAVILKSRIISVGVVGLGVWSKRIAAVVRWIVGIVRVVISLAIDRRGRIWTRSVFLSSPIRIQGLRSPFIAPSPFVTRGGRHWIFSRAFVDADSDSATGMTL